MHAVDYSVLLLMALYWMCVFYFLASIYFIVRWTLRGKSIAQPLWLFARSYVTAGLCLAMAFKLAIPATKWWGVAYFTAIWLPWQLQSLTGWMPPVPNWVFTV